MLIRRYLFKEVSHTFLAVILVIFLIAVSNKLVRLVSHAASGDVAPNVLFQLIYFQMPELLAFLLPVGLFIAILLCYSRFFAENEIPVMFACGVSWQRLLMVSLGLSIIVMFISGFFTCYWSPKLAHYREQLLRQEGPMFLVQTVAPGRFHAFEHDKLIFYVADLNTDRSKLKHIFIAEQPKGNASVNENWSVITAKEGQILPDSKTKLNYATLFNGKRYDGTPGEMDYSVLTFDQYRHLIDEPNKQEELYYHRSMPTKRLYQQQTPGNLAELQWRLSIPFSAPLLAMLAVPLSRVNPRGGRNIKLFFAIMICILYFNLLTLSKRWVAAGELSPWIGVWWVHLLMLAGALAVLAHTSGRAKQCYQLLKQKFNAHG